MITREQIRALRQAGPFRPFVIRSADGGTCKVNHPEHMACGPAGVEMCAYDALGILHIFHMDKAELIEDITPATESSEK